MTLIYELDLVIQQMYLHVDSELSRSRFQKLEAYRQTDTAARISNMVVDDELNLESAEYEALLEACDERGRLLEICRQHASSDVLVLYVPVSSGFLALCQCIDLDRQFILQDHSWC